MGISSISSTPAANAYSPASASKPAAAETGEAVARQDSYESAAAKTAEEGTVYKPNTALVNSLKEEQAKIQERFLNTVKDMLTKQGIAVAEGDGIWKQIAVGNFQVDAEAQAAAQKAIADDGYWGVNQTSDRIIQYATALSGGDPDQLEKMISAFQRGYAEAEKAWGNSLPELSQRTYDAVMDKFEELKKQYANQAAGSAE